jgi:pSer/pThr/pTyr-binding forkhead associated (FHA) protein
MNSHLVLVETSPPFAAFDLLPTRRTYVLGRSSKCDMVVNHVSVSRRHAQITLGDSTVLVSDLQSCNGTFINDERVTQASITRGQCLRLGNVSFILTGTEVEEDSFDSEVATDNAGSYRHPGAEPTVPDSAASTLTAAQLRVFRLLLAGLLEKNIAHRLSLSLHTVHNHVRAIYKAFGVHSRPQLLSTQLQKRHAPDDDREGRGFQAGKRSRETK